MTGMSLNEYQEIIDLKLSEIEQAPKYSNIQRLALDHLMLIISNPPSDDTDLEPLFGRILCARIERLLQIYDAPGKVACG